MKAPLPISLWVAGCGYVGRPLAERLHREQVSVLGLTRSDASALTLQAQVPFPVRGCDIRSLPALRSLADIAGAPEVIVHCASSGRDGVAGYQSVYYEGCVNLLAACPDAQLLFTSSTSVYPQTGGETVTEASPACPSGETGRILRAAENQVLGRDGIIARLSGIYGPGRSVFLQRLFDGSAVIEAGPSRFLNQIHRDDIVAALIHLLRHRQTISGEIFNVTDGDHLTQRSRYEELAAFFHRPLPPEGPVNPGQKREWTHKRVDSSKLRALGWAPRYASFLDALRRDPELIPSIQRRLASSEP